MSHEYEVTLENKINARHIAEEIERLKVEYAAAPPGNEHLLQLIDIHRRNYFVLMHQWYEGVVVRDSKGNPVLEKPKNPIFTCGREKAVTYVPLDQSPLLRD